MTGSSTTTGCHYIKRHLTPKGLPWKGGVRARAIESCAIFSLVGTFHFTGSDVIKRHVTPSGFPWKGGVCDQMLLVRLSLENMGTRMRNRKCPWGVILFVFKPNPKEDWNVLYHQPITSLEIEPIRLQEMNQPDPSFQKWTTNYNHRNMREFHVIFYVV